MKSVILPFAILLTLHVQAQMNHEYKVTATYHISSPGGWDYIAVHDGSLYASHGTQVNILNEANGDSTGAFDVAFRM